MAYTGEFRLIFDTIPEQFEKYRGRYCVELFEALISYANIKPGLSVLELGPGTGQASEPIIATGCDYTAIELGDNFAALLDKKYGSLVNVNENLSQVLSNI